MGAENSFETETITAQKKVPKTDGEDTIGGFRKWWKPLRRQLR